VQTRDTAFTGLLMSEPAVLAMLQASGSDGEQTALLDLEVWYYAEGDVLGTPTVRMAVTVERTHLACKVLVVA